MAVLQSIPAMSRGSTFADLAFVTQFAQVTSPFKADCPRVDFVTDQYPTVSIKGCERARRSQGGVLRINILQPSSLFLDSGKSTCRAGQTKWS